VFSEATEAIHSRQDDVMSEDKPVDQGRRRSLGSAALGMIVGLTAGLTGGVALGSSTAPPAPRRIDGRHRFEGKTVLVTGATSGIGRAVALKLAEAGAEVIVAGRDGRRGAETVAAIEALGNVTASQSVSGQGYIVQIYRNTGATAIGNISTFMDGITSTGSTNESVSSSNMVLDNPQTTNSTQYGLYIQLTTGTSTRTFLGTNGGIPTNTGVMTIEEIMGANDNQPGIPALPMAGS